MSTDFWLIQRLSNVSPERRIVMSLQLKNYKKLEDRLQAELDQIKALLDTTPEELAIKNDKLKSHNERLTALLVEMENLCKELGLEEGEKSAPADPILSVGWESVFDGNRRHRSWT